MRWVTGLSGFSMETNLRVFLRLICFLATFSIGSAVIGAPDSIPVKIHGNRILAESLHTLLQSAKTLTLSGCVIEGAVEFHDTVSGDIRISDCLFMNAVNMDSAVFMGKTEFLRCTYSEAVSFRKTAFKNHMWFTWSVFQKPVDFTGVKIWLSGDFSECEFRDTLVFKNATVYGDTARPEQLGMLNYSRTKFLSDTDFSNDTLEVEVLFNDAVFSAYVNYANCSFLGGAGFWRTKFNGYVDLVRTRQARHVNFYETQFLGHKERLGRDCAGSFDGAILLYTTFLRTSLDRMIFTPDSVSEETLRAFAHAGSLRSLTYYYDPSPLAYLRSGFRKNDLRQKAREITCALRRHDQNTIERALFDWTSEWGSNLFRPIQWLLAVWLFAAILYACLMLRSKKPVLLLVSYSTPDESGEVAKQVSPIGLGGDNRTIKSHVCGYVTVLSWSLFYSLMSTFNLGFRDVSFGRLLRLVLPRKVDFVAVGLVRTIAGVQAILSVGLLALLLLSYFGRPFE